MIRSSEFVQTQKPSSGLRGSEGQYWSKPICDDMGEEGSSRGSFAGYMREGAVVGFSRSLRGQDKRLGGLPAGELQSPAF